MSATSLEDILRVGAVPEALQRRQRGLIITQLTTPAYSRLRGRYYYAVQRQVAPRRTVSAKITL